MTTDSNKGAGLAKVMKELEDRMEDDDPEERANKKQATSKTGVLSSLVATRGCLTLTPPKKNHRTRRA
jgi:hypothetical protein